MPTFQREDTRSVTLKVDDRTFDRCESHEGGTGDSEEAKPRLGAMGPQVALGGPKTRDNVTVTILYDTDAIGADYKWLDGRRGVGRCIVTEQTLDGDGNVHGQRITETGVLKAVSRTDYDAQGSDEAYITLEISTDGPIA